MSAQIPHAIQQLWIDADRIWEQRQQHREYFSYASADYIQVYQSLQKLQGKAHSMLEFGSGLGVVTLMASHLGFKSFGIECQPELVDLSREFAAAMNSTAEFACGSFIPDGYRWNPSDGDESVRTEIDLPDAYGELDMQLDEFDLIYAYPWPTEHGLYDNVLRQFARSGALYLSYDAREGMNLVSL